MPKSKKRKKTKKTPSRKIKVFRLSEKQSLEGAKHHLKRETLRILEYIKKRKETSKDSEEYSILSFQIKTLINSYNSVAELHGLDTI